MGLLDFFSKAPPQAPTPPGGGLLGTTQKVVTDQRAYKDYAEMAMTKGQPVLPYAEWVKQQQAPVKK